MNGSYVIAGDTKSHKDCLVYVVGSDYKRAEEVLNRMLNNPTDDDKGVMTEHTNLRIEFVESKDCWWNN